MSRDVDRRVVRARFAVFVLFASFGGVLSTWVVHLPELKAATGISTAVLGTVLLVLGVGSLAGMQLIGFLIDRFGSEIVAVVAGAAMPLALLAPLSASRLGHALAGAFVFGVAAGCADVSMNAAAVSVERDYERPIMAAFHGVFSIGTVVGSLLGAAGFALHVGTIAMAAAVCAGCLVLVSVALANLRGRLRHRRAATDATADGDRKTAPGHRRKVLLLGAVAFLLLLAEGSAMDWGSLHAQQHLGVSASLGAVAVGTFLVAMTVGRFTVDRVAAQVGPVWVLRGGALLAAVGIALVIVAPWYALVLVGWSLMGLGLAGGVPQVFTAAGNLGGMSGRTLSRVVGVGYIAILSGPAIIGWLVELISWRGAFLVPLAAVLISAGAARAVAPRGERHR